MSDETIARVEYRTADGVWRELGSTAWQRYGRHGEVIGYDLDRPALNAALRAVGLPASPPPDPPDDDEEEGRHRPAPDASPGTRTRSCAPADWDETAPGRRIISSPPT